MSKDDKLWGGLCHLVALSGLVVSPFLAIIGVLVVWLVKRDDSGFIDDQGKESLNFQLNVWILSFVLAVLCITVILIPFCLIGLGVLWIAWLVLTIIGGVSALDGKRFRYPFMLFRIV